jgi:hypothetical protein
MKRKRPKPACFAYNGKKRQYFMRHKYVLHCDSDGNYRCCERPGCGMVSLRLAAGERDRVR